MTSNLPTGWKIHPLEKVAFLNMGQSPDSSTYNSEGIGLPFFQGKKDFGKLHPQPTQYCSAPVKIAQPNDILMSVRAPVGPTNIANAECCIGRGLAAIRTNPEILDLFYLHYFFKYFETEISEMGKGSTFAAITKAELANLQIPLPPLDEQKRLVSLLDTLLAKIDRSIELLSENITAVDALLSSALNTVFGELGEKYSLNELTKVIEGKIQNGLYKHKDYYNENGTKILRIDNFYNGKVNATGIKRLSLTNDEIEKYLLNENDIVINRVNSIEYLGKCAFIDKQIEPMVFESNMMKFSVNEITASMYIVYMLQCSQIKEQVEKKAKRAINQCSINQTDVNTLLIPLPPLDIQIQIVEYIDSIRTKVEILKQVQNDKITHLKALKASILDRAFKGEL